MPPTAISAAIFLHALTLRRITAGHKAISSKPAQESLIVTLKTHKSESKDNAIQQCSFNDKASL